MVGIRLIAFAETTLEAAPNSLSLDGNCCEIGGTAGITKRRLRLQGALVSLRALPKPRRKKMFAKLYNFRLKPKSLVQMEVENVADSVVDVGTETLELLQVP